ncbi:MAG: DUF423 domain-containing protein [Anaerolineae bacterium]|jgi:uncharacterized membrane protein YgdD (TMEM256/DUF423 family)|nr:DUF423 domain-containing protein [Anaerolineae bacterium]MBT7191718.1 DUF423 domain-containing protein [Anaerolineae bacterium]
MKNKFFVIGSFLAGLAVATGAFGAHGLQKMVTPEKLTAWDKAARYQMYHAFALFFVAWTMSQWLDQAKTLENAGKFFILGTILFSGSLYILTFTGSLKVLGINLAYLTPMGGVAYVVGWFLLMKASWQAQN